MKNRFRTKTLILLSTLSLLSASELAMAKENKVALVIGNKSYKDVPLKNSVNDAKDMKTALEKAGFTVIYAIDANQKKMDEAREKFVNALTKDSIGLFYYSGHGVQADGVNYLIPIDANIKSKVDLKYNAYDVNYFLDEMENAENPVNIVILDACRNNPYKGVRSISGGLANADAPTSAQGSLIAYATAPNSVADDNQKGNNGLYTKYLKQYLFAPGLTIEAALKKVGAAVKKENPDQIPWQSNSLTEDVCLGGCTSPAVKPVTPIVLTNNSPLLSFVSGAATVEKDKTYTVNFKATDKDKDLSQIQIDWLDGSDVTSKNAVDGAALSFTHNYTFAGIYALVATAIDNAGNVSKDVAKSVTVKEPAVVVPPVVKVPSVASISLSKQSVIHGNEISFFATLNLALPASYFVKVNYGDGFETMNGSGKNFDLTAIPNASAAYKIGIYDSKGVLKSNQLTGNFSVTEPAPVVVVPPVVIKTTGYSKIANNGSLLSDSAKLGANPTDWACTQDNKTGLIWEVKTTDGGLRDSAKTYTNYTPDYPKCGWSDCETSYPGKYGDSTNTDGFVMAVNNQSLCGNNDWRLPTNAELKGLVFCSDSKYNTLAEGDSGFICSSSENGLTTTSPTINATYFPNTQSDWFWSSSPVAYSSSYAWFVYFNYGSSYVNLKDFSNYVRLVRG